MVNKYEEINESAIKRFLKNYAYYSEEDRKIKCKVIQQFKSSKENNGELDVYRKALWKMISNKVILFNREILIYIAEFLREMVCMNNFPRNSLELMMEINEIAIIMQKAIFDNWESFTNKTWYINPNYLNELRELLYLYKRIIQNIAYARINNIAIEIDNLFEIIEDEELDNYFIEYDKYFRTLKLENETIDNKELNEYLHSKKLLPHQIRKSGNHAIESTLGFNYDDLELLKENICILKNYETVAHHFCIKKEKFIEMFSNYIDFERVESIVKYLSINHLYGANEKPGIRDIELRCISEQNGNLYFGLYNLFESIDIFQNIGISGHFIKELGIPEKEKSRFSKLNDKFSTFFSYKIADLLNSSGYVLPKKDGIIQVELCEIEIDSNKVLKFKDIDVLAVDTQNSILYNFELKYFKLNLAYSKLKKDKFNENLFKSFICRNERIEENKGKILEKLFGINNGGEYKVKPVLITSRTNYKSRKDISYYNFESFKEKLRLKEVL